MRLIEQVKQLRKEFPDIRIRQLSDRINRVCAVFELDNCSENIKLYFEHNYIILEFYDSKTIYGYPENEFRYLIDELHSLIDCRILVLSVESRNEKCGSVLVSADLLDRATITDAAKRLCREKFGGSLPKNAFVNLCYCDTGLDSCEYCDFTK